jgi:hypothetical protein
MSMPSTINGSNEVTPPPLQGDQTEDWPPLPNLDATQERRVTLAPEPEPDFQNPNFEKQNHGSGSILIEWKS